MTWARIREALALRIRQIQTISDAELPTLPTSSRYFLAPFLSLASTLNIARQWYPHSTFRLPAPVLSINNLTSASGKTPFVEHLARHYWENHALASLIIQLGSGTVDETVMLKQAFEGTDIKVIDTENVHEAKEILRENPSLRLVLLDNGLHNLPVEKDFDILTINSLAPFGNGHLRPRGLLREPYRRALKRTDFCVLHHVDIAAPEQLARAQTLVGGFLPRHALRMQTQMAPVSLRSLVSTQRSLDMSEFQELGEDLGLSKLNGAAVLCLTGVGSPATVEMHLRQLGALHVEGCGAHEDHHMFSVEEVEEAVVRVRELAQDGTFTHACILLTEKDYARQFDLWSSVFSRYAEEVLPHGCENDDDDDSNSGVGTTGIKKWGAYVLHSKLQVVEHDKRFSSQKAALGAMLRISIDNFRRRNAYVS